MLRNTFLWKLQTPSTKLCQKKFKWFFTSKEPLFQSRHQRKSYNFEIKLTLYYSKYLVLYFWPLLFLCRTDGSSNLYAAKKNSFIKILQVQLIKGHMEIAEWTHSGRWSAWYIKTIWKLQYQFVNTQIYWLLG